MTVDQTLTSVTVAPSTASLGFNETQQFNATAFDQFNNAMATQPTFSWSIDPLGVGSVDTNGLYTSPATNGTATVRATADLLFSGTASVSVGDVAPVVVLGPIATPNPVTGTTTVLSVIATDLGGLGNLNYTWSATVEPGGANPLFSTNGSTSSDITTVTFDHAGAYTFQVDISDGAQSTSGTVNVTVDQTLTTVTVSPGTATLALNATQQFTAAAFDQFNIAMATQPTFTWSVDLLGVGSVDSTGLYTAPGTAGTATVRATADLIFSGTASVAVGNTPPVVVVGATATPNPVTGTTTLLSVIAIDDGGLAGLTYTWLATAKPGGANPIFSVNESNGAAITTVTFNEAGNYTFTVEISDGSLSTPSSVNVTVDQTLTTVAVSPSTASLALNATQQFAATAFDQFANAMATQPTFSWSIDPLGVGSVDSTGLYTAANTAGSATVRATADLLFSGAASVTVANTAPVVVVGATATPNPVTGTTTILSVVATDDGGLPNLTYTWSATAKPGGANPIFSVNGTNGAAIATVTFNEAGNYTFTVEISDGSLSTPSSVNVVVDQTMTIMTLSPTAVSLATNANQQFAANALDQFGNAMAAQPTFTWSIDPLGVGAIDSNGLYTAPVSAGAATVARRRTFYSPVLRQ